MGVGWGVQVVYSVFGVNAFMYHSVIYLFDEHLICLHL